MLQATTLAMAILHVSLPPHLMLTFSLLITTQSLPLVQKALASSLLSAPHQCSLSLPNALQMFLEGENDSTI